MQLGRGLAEVLAALLTKILTEKAGIHRSEQYHMGMTHVIAEGCLLTKGCKRVKSSRMTPVPC